MSFYHQWYPEVNHFCRGVPLVLIGCKTDLRKDKELLRKLRASKQEPITYNQVSTSALKMVSSLQEIKHTYTSIASLLTSTIPGTPEWGVPSIQIKELLTALRGVSRSCFWKWPNHHSLLVPTLREVEECFAYLGVSERTLLATPSMLFTSPSCFLSQLGYYCYRFLSFDEFVGLPSWFWWAYIAPMTRTLIRIVIKTGDARIQATELKTPLEKTVLQTLFKNKSFQGQQQQHLQGFSSVRGFSFKWS